MTTIYGLLIIHSAHKMMHVDWLPSSAMGFPYRPARYGLVGFKNKPDCSKFYGATTLPSEKKVKTINTDPSMSLRFFRTGFAPSSPRLYDNTRLKHSSQTSHLVKFQQWRTMLKCRPKRQQNLPPLSQYNNSQFSLLRQLNTTTRTLRGYFNFMQTLNSQSEWKDNCSD